ncbi:HWE histidine kinase domain-containing protein [Paraburkholderia caledonica]|uniref:HWE histidine kinase domain-containing protein n=1 Tax=Paraburkholderia caledonica TaxID=134536 RepID=UPI00286A0FDE|nr:HWE histidine kinase domain-containing protein [Paraburkholderia caledonica]
MAARASVPPYDLYITPELQRGVPNVVDHLGEKLALQDIGAQMLDHPEQLLPKLVERAMLMTGATSAGISAFEPQEGTAGIFRWRHLRGKLAPFEGGTTPRNYSPCGVCLDRFEPTLTRHPERHYSWIAEAGVSCPEVLLVPLYVAHGQPLGTLWIVSEEEGHFDSGHARIMRELASFVAIALAMQQNQERLREALNQQEMLTREMDHRVNNVFAVVDSMIQVGARLATSTADFAKTLSGRLHALAASHALARQSPRASPTASVSSSATLRGLTDAIFEPYRSAEHDRFIVIGEDLSLGEQAMTGLALVLHELATNAAKYGALSADGGRVLLSWERRDEVLDFLWQEDGGPTIDAPPEKEGFGAMLLRNSVTRRFRGSLELRWHKQGLKVRFALPLASLAA